MGMFDVAEELGVQCNMMHKAVYTESFDPPIMGHVWMIREGARIFDQLVVAVGENPDKKCAFGLDRCLAWLGEIAGEVAGSIQVVIVYKSPSGGRVRVECGIKSPL